jgi:hypothetical protein
VYMNCSVLSLDAFIFYSPSSVLTYDERKGKGRTCVRISRTSLNPMEVSANLDCNIITTLLLCSETCLLPLALLRLDRTNDWRDAICWFRCAMSCLMMYVSSYDEQLMSIPSPS